MKRVVLGIGLGAALAGCRVDSAYDAGGLVCGGSDGNCPVGFVCTAPYLFHEEGTQICEPATCANHWNGCSPQDAGAGFLPQNPAVSPIACHCSSDCPCPMNCVVDFRVGAIDPGFFDGGVCERGCGLPGANDECLQESIGLICGGNSTCGVQFCGQAGDQPCPDSGVCGANHVCVPKS